MHFFQEELGYSISSESRISYVRNKSRKIHHPLRWNGINHEEVERDSNMELMTEGHNPVVRYHIQISPEIRHSLLSLE